MVICKKETNEHTVLEIIINLGPTRSKAANKCRIPIDQIIKSRHNEVLSLFNLLKNEY